MRYGQNTILHISHPFIWQMCFVDIILPIYGLDYVLRMLTSVCEYIPLYPCIYLITGTSKTVEKWVKYVQNSILTSVATAKATKLACSCSW